MKIENIYKYSFLVLFLLAVIAYHYFGYIGHYGYDDLHYAKLAYNLNHGNMDYNDHYTYRILPVFLTSVSYSIFGVNDTASSFPSIIITFGILFIVFHVLREYGIITLITGLSLTTFTHWFIFYSDKLMPDIYVAFSVIFSLYIIYHLRYVSKKKNTFLYSFLFSTGLISGFLSKETIILITPLLLYLFVTDIFLKRNIKFWVLSIIFNVIIFSCYFIIIRHLTGEAGSRFQAIISNSYLNLCSYDKQPFVILLKRISYGFFAMLVSQAMITGLVFVVIHLFHIKIKQLFVLDDPFSFFMVSTLVLLLSCNFMSISVTHYIPMCLDPRHYLFLIPVAATPASQIIAQFFKQKQHSAPILVVLFIMLTVSYLLPENTGMELYIPLFILFLISFLLPDKFRIKCLFVLLFVLVLAVKPFTMISYAGKIKYKKQKEIVFDFFINKCNDCFVITNEVQAELGNYYNKFGNTGKCKFVSFNDFKPDTLVYKEKYLLLNWYTEYLSGLDYNSLPYYARNIDPANTLVYNDKELNISIYKLNKIPVINNNIPVIFHSFNGFEKQEKYWIQNDKEITDDVKYEGNKSLALNEFSSTLTYPIDSLNLGGSDEITISSTLYCLVRDKTDSKIVITLENKEGGYIWQASGINKYIKAYNNWWPVKFEQSLSVKDIKKNSTLKIYLWNAGKENIYIDNFDVKVLKINQ